MGLPTVTKTWTTSFNNRYTWLTSSTNLLEMGAFAYSLFGTGGFLTSTMGYTVKGSSNGTTAAMDGVNRITSTTSWGTRANSSISPICWIVLTDGAGVNWCFSYNSSSDGTLRLAHSTGGNYALASTSTWQPTATDECFDSATNDWLITGSIGTRGDQVWHLWASSDKKMFRIVTTSFTNIAVTGFGYGAYIAGETFTSALQSPATTTLATGGGTVAAVKSYYQGANGSGGRTFTFTSNLNVGYTVLNAADLSRVNNGSGDGNAQVTIGGEIPGAGRGCLAGGGGGTWSADKPALQGNTGYTWFPATMGGRTASFDGMLGSKIDNWYVLAGGNSGPPFLTMFGQAKFWAIYPGCVLVGDGSTLLTDR